LQTILTDNPAEAASYICAGEIVAFPTETVYGLGANVFEARAVEKIFAAKGRPSDNPLIVHIADLSQLPSITSEISTSAQKLIAAFFPGPLTVIVPRSDAVPMIATAGLQTVGVRQPRHPIAQEFLKACGVPVAAPSANLSGSPSPTTWQAVQTDLNGRVRCILRGGVSDVGLESTVVDCTGDAPVILRTGAVTLEQLQQVVPSTRLARTEDKREQRSPGMKYRHYAPQARVVIISSPDEATASAQTAFIGLGKPASASSFGLHLLCLNVENYAHELFQFFRRCDAAHIKTIYCQAVQEKGLGLALMDRIRRAAMTISE
jgi:L-threonylcarbamoyladenylate synthase